MMRDQSEVMLRLVPPHRIAGKREREMFLLRTLDGWTYREIADRFGLSKERVRQLLRSNCGLIGIPPAVKARRRPRSGG